MKIWARICAQQKIKDDVVMEFPGARPADMETWQQTIGALAEALHLSRPVLLSKHIAQLLRFAHTVFLPADFLETVSFERFEIEIFPDKKPAPSPD